MSESSRRQTRAAPVSPPYSAQTGLRRGVCVVCADSFSYTGRGSPSKCCSEPCRLVHRRRLARVRAVRWARRMVESELAAGSVRVRFEGVNR
jgi:hypothetical protein